MIATVTHNGQSIEVAGRVARMILALVNLRGQIDRIPVGQLVLHFAHDQLKTSVTESHAVPEVPPVTEGV